jgi:hypothetical protein
MIFLRRAAKNVVVAVTICWMTNLACGRAILMNVSEPAQHRNASNKRAHTVKKRGWHIPTYYGLILGRSNKTDVRRTFGIPVWVGPPESAPLEKSRRGELLYEYEDVGAIKGRTSILLDKRTGLLKGISIYPQHLTLEEVRKQYGINYIERDNALGPCPLERELHNYIPPQAREYPFFLIYPQLGLFVSIQRDSTVLEIGYVSHCP